jgi:hypothetical protein
MKYTLIAEDEFGGSTTTREFTADYLPEVLSEIELFLKGAGFVFDGNLDFVNDFETEPEWEPEEEWTTPEWDTPQTDTAEWDKVHSKHYFDTQRNK